MSDIVKPTRTNEPLREQLKEMIEPLEHWEYIQSSRGYGKSYERLENYINCYVRDLENEIQRLNNIIKQIEKYLLEETKRLDVPRIENLSELHRIVRLEAINNILDKLKELKGE